MDTIIELRFPERVGVVLTIVSTVEELKKVRDQLDACPEIRMKWPLSEFTKQVNAAINEAEFRWDSLIHMPSKKPADAKAE